MSQFSVTIEGLAEMQHAFRLAPKKLADAEAKAFKRFGQSDIKKMVDEQLSGGDGLNIKSKGARNSFKYKVTGRHADEITLREYTGSKMMEIFQTGGTISANGKMLTVLTAAARDGSGKRNITQKELRAMVDSGAAAIVKLSGDRLAIIVEQHKTITGRTKQMQVLAFLVPAVEERQRIDFFRNFESNSAEHQRILQQVSDEVVKGLATDK
jgi:hypothetical protein